ncbi:MAG: hypothetical protein ABI899_06030 [Actinomycetota bacterium]
MVVNVRSAVSVGLIWLAAVAGVSGTAWIAINRAGRDITDGSVNSQSPLTVVNAPVATTPGIGATSTEVTTSPTAEPERPTTPEPSATPSSPVAPAPSVSPTSATGPGPGPSRARDGTFSATGGQVTVRCTGGTIQLRIAQPNDTWRVEVGSAGPQEVHVTFMHGGEEGGVGTQVTAVCAGGAPAFSVTGDN